MIEFIMMYLLQTTLIYNNNTAGSCGNATTLSQGFIGLYQCADKGLSTIFGYNFVLGIGMTAFFFILITGILAVRNVDIINAALAASFFNIVISLFLQQIGLLGSGTIVLWIGLTTLSAFMSMVRGAQKPYG
jgi:hypothetical protein